MADISQITLPSGNTYDIKDASARASIPNKISTSEKGSANGVAELDSNGKVPSSQLPAMTGATSTTAGSTGLVPAPSTTDVDLFLSGDGTWKAGGKPMVILSYGISTWQDFMYAYNNNVIVYCRASSNANPASGAQNRMAFMAYVNGASNPTNVEFQYYRSMSSHTASATTDEVYVYKLESTNKWTVTIRKAGSIIKAGTYLSSTYANDTETLNVTLENKAAASGGTDVSLVSTGDKYIWNNKIDSSEKGAASGVAELDGNAKVPTIQLPDSVFDVVDYSSYSNFPVIGSSDTFYVDTSTNAVYRWDGTEYTQINQWGSSITNAEIDLLFA